MDWSFKLRPQKVFVTAALAAALLLSLFALLGGGKPSQAIVSGKEVSNDKYPFYARIVTEEPLLGPIKLAGGCGGSLIDKNSVLTAAHCIGSDPETLKKYGKVIVQGQERKICDIQVHPAYDLNGGQGQLNDVAVLTLEPPIQNPEPIRLASVKQKNTLETPGGKATVLGAKGKVAQVRISRDTVAANYWSDYDPDLHISTWNKKKYVEPGDSGGPLFVKKCKKGKVRCRYIQIGIVANGRHGARWWACDLVAQKKCPDVYTDVNNPSISEFITKAKTTPSNQSTCPKKPPKQPNKKPNTSGGPAEDTGSSKPTPTPTPDPGVSATPDPGASATPGPGEASPNAGSSAPPDSGSSAPPDSGGSTGPGVG